MQGIGAVQDAERQRIAEEDALAGYEGADKVVDSDQKRQEIRENPKKQLNFKTGFAALDALISGVSAGEMVVVGGRRKNGKTLLCQTLTGNFRSSEPGANSMWFSYEVPVEQLLEQMPTENLFYLPNILTTNTLDWLRQRVVEAKIKYDVRIIFIDHLHYLIDMARARNPSLEIGAIVRGLKRMAIDLGVVVFLISHVRGVDAGAEVTEDHLRDSSLTSAEADTTWIVSRLFDKDTKEATDVCEVNVCNHRRTGVMRKKIRLVKRGKTLIEYGQGDHIEMNLTALQVTEKPTKFYKDHISNED